MNSASRVSLRWPVLIGAAVVLLAVGAAAAYVGLRLRAPNGLPSEQAAAPKTVVPAVGPATERAASSPEASAPLPDVGPTGGLQVTGEVLRTRGFWIPRRRPETVTLVRVERVG